MEKNRIRGNFLRLVNTSDKSKQKYMELYNNIIKEPTEKPNVMGLYFDEEYLKTIDKNVVLLPLEIMANYRDADCELMVQRKSLEILDFWYCVDKNWKEINATSIGNIAYIILNYDNDELVNSAVCLLDNILEKYTNFLLQQLKKALNNDNN